MFPYQLRPPMYGGKLGKERKKAHEAAILPAATTTTRSEQGGGGLLDVLDVYHHPLADGGPLQRAVRTDMALLRDVFLHQWNDHQSQPRTVSLQNTGVLDDPQQQNVSSRHDAPGAAFSVFKEIFQRGSFAMLHTRTMPPKVERDKYTQLLYESCLLLMEQSFSQTAHMDNPTTSSDTCNVDDVPSKLCQEAASVVFALYTLYQTSPLPMPPPVPPPPSTITNARANKMTSSVVTKMVDKERWTTLPLSIHDPENPKVLYRRAYRGPIRIGWKHFSMLQHQLRDLCLAETSTCEARRMTQWSHQCHHQASKHNMPMNREDSNTTCATERMEGDSTIISWKCNCGLARAAVLLLDRMRNENMMDLCEYSGPVGLEGLAGSADYYRTNVLKQPPKELPPGSILSTEQLDELVATHEDTHAIDDILNMTELTASIEEYHKSIESIHLPLLRGTARSLHNIASGLLQSDNGDGQNNRIMPAKQSELVHQALGPVLSSHRSRPRITDQAIHALRGLSDASVSQSVVSKVDQIVSSISTTGTAAAANQSTTNKQLYPAAIGTTGRAISQRLERDIHLPSHEIMHKNQPDGSSVAGATSETSTVASETQLSESGVDVSDASKNNGTLEPLEMSQLAIERERKIIMPESFSVALRHGIQKALCNVMEEWVHAKESMDEKEEARSVTIGTLATPKGTSVVFDPTQASVKTQSSDYGNVALRQLLRSAKQSTTTPSSKAPQQAVLDTLPIKTVMKEDAFLRMDTESLYGSEDEWGEVDKSIVDNGILSSDDDKSSSSVSYSQEEDDGELSIAASCVGQNALHDLLSAVKTKGIAKPKPKRKAVASSRQKNDTAPKEKKTTDTGEGNKTKAENDNDIRWSMDLQKHVTKNKSNPRRKRKQAVVRMMHPDDFSCASSAVGAGALASLLGQVTKPDEIKRNLRSRSRRKRNQMVETTPQADDFSYASNAVGSGALASLLGRATKRSKQQTLTESKPDRKAHSGRKIMTKAAIEPQMDDVSCASTAVGAGALAALLNKANENVVDHESCSEEHNSDGMKDDNLNEAVSTTTQSDNVSCASSAVGAGTLAPLLGRVTKPGESKRNLRSHSRRKRTQIVETTPQADDVSYASSAVGAGALASLLGRATKHKQQTLTKTKPYRKAHSGRKTMTKAATEPQMDDVSCASTAVGAGALAALLNKVNKRIVDHEGLSEEHNSDGMVDDNLIE